MGVSLAEPVQLDGFVSEVRQGFVRGPLPQHRQLVIMDPVEQFDMSKGATLGCARVAQWWAPGTPLLCKMVNTSKAPAVALWPGVWQQELLPWKCETRRG